MEDNNSETVQEETENKDLGESLSRLVSSGVLLPIDVLKLRLDVVTEMLASPALLDLINRSYEERLGRLLEDAEGFAIRQSLLRP